MGDASGLFFNVNVVAPRTARRKSSTSNGPSGLNVETALAPQRSHRQGSINSSTYSLSPNWSPPQRSISLAPSTTGRQGGLTPPPPFHEFSGRLTEEPEEHQLVTPPRSSYSSEPRASDTFAAPAGPPGYFRALHAPTLVPVTYQFSPHGLNTIVLEPVTEAGEYIRPRYYISVSMNPFIPSSYITTVHCGDRGSGEVVGDFEYPGTPTLPATLTIRGTTQKLDTNVIEKEKNKGAGIWRWRFVHFPILWECCQIPFVAYSKKKDNQYARFWPQDRLSNPPACARLEVTVDGQRFFDDLVLSILYIERRRLGG